jgi:transcriptional regulator with XRE-family HTH domain
MSKEVDRDQMGRKIRERRIELGLSQEELGEKLGVSYQQIQKYEKGASQLTVEKLQKIAYILGVKIDYFLKDMPPLVSETPAPYGGLSIEEKKLLKQYRHITDPSARLALLRLIQVMGRLTQKNPYK